ncbi:dienelactone hydrolase family protein [uncultured Thiothrix sp.]|uniref:alpha/beta hydrolase n=1 Tax=uncultured Thiothrix sp. TaxID=223185 RepID=UPI00260219EA|nr:dienelactone hydrolase family protein [uncultured Thiothrix sp.]HMT93294.1 dienelactone hydrolase family protein [Thiolinea sp.]
MDYLPALLIEPSQTATASVIWLHGLGADGHDFEPIVPELKLPTTAAIRFIFPHAPAIPVTINGGYVMPAWYDILAMDIDRKVDVKQLEASAQAVAQLIDRELEKGIPSERIVLAGFSQGGAVAYQTALSYPKPLGGLLALSTYFATADTIQFNAANQNLPIAIFHGSQDSVVPESLGKKAQQRLQALGYTPEYFSYAMEHSVSAAEVQDLARFIQQWLFKAE